jgi:protein-disulfide isomerase
MSKRTSIIIFIAAIGLVAAGLLYKRLAVDEQNASMAQDAGALVRPSSPIIGPRKAPVTIVEFFDPSCEGCRAFYPYVKRIMEEYPNDVSLVIRYVLFHEGSEEASRILEAAHAGRICADVGDGTCYAATVA